ncbi:MAG: stringent starvation protein A [Pseudomonadales bacterium]|uniref:glutathione S-transferase N-terminal domain-containing protein n=1 Tax=unclassified Ketobacter TaxID=2639109 RepID=UPI000C66C217|nr:MULTISPECIES: glutathione S-transferase N-terminal domain-containing protein [unclassified Ketobacter]MAA59762.1 stringent starvation protein A [Pseudomonadales bacterium]MEC8811084.1 glutathione S-transferase N-terminal domain-containing protein [Pseudomonadota bacterium]HCB39689.1 stringent starvation protein A [Gammaproteobacteria bacterium]MAQ25370.1 stringent starvation protein A [Pseudomonadales bacterium]MBI25912.1 stringent starvation protein A [Pseudomonadales bacterium]|tara:strand:+ start:29960 stop:30592 length:633 start_codon:yes stop_codon:yes gene_type:complete
MGVIAKRSSMTFFSDGNDHYSHRVRIVLAEKGVAVDVLDVDPAEKPEDLATLNPYNELPTLVDRELTLYEPNIMMEYLDERFPHPPLLPVYPVERARSRLLMHRIHRDWCDAVDALMAGTEKDAVLNKHRKDFTENLVAIDPIFSEKPFFMSDDFTLVDCVVAPILWRLPAMGIELQKSKSGNLLAYADRLFARESFQASLSDAERELRL